MSDRTLTEQKQVLAGTVSVREVLSFIESDRYMDLKEVTESPRGRLPGEER